MCKIFDSSNLRFIVVVLNAIVRYSTRLVPPLGAMLSGLMGGILSTESDSCNRSEDSIDDYHYDKSQRIHLRDHFRLPQFIFDRTYESHDQFITVATDDGLKMLHIYHLSKTMGQKTHRSKSSNQQPRRLFHDYKTGFTYYYTKDCYGNERYRRLPTRA